MTSCRPDRRAASTKLEAEHRLQDEEVRKHHDAQNDAVDAEALEVVTADEAHKPLDGDERNHKGHNAAHAQMATSLAPNVPPLMKYLTSLSALAPNMTGMAGRT